MSPAGSYRPELLETIWRSPSFFSRLFEAAILLLAFNDSKERA
jgi:hypothetical protein